MRKRLAVKNGVCPNFGSSAIVRSFATRLPVMRERLRVPRVTLRERAVVIRLSIIGRKVLASTKRGIAATAKIGSAMAAARPTLTDFFMHPPRSRKGLLGPHCARSFLQFADHPHPRIGLTHFSGDYGMQIHRASIMSCSCAMLCHAQVSKKKT